VSWLRFLRQAYRRASVAPTDLKVTDAADVGLDLASDADMLFEQATRRGLRPTLLVYLWRKLLVYGALGAALVVVASAIPATMTRSVEAFTSGAAVNYRTGDIVDNVVDRAAGRVLLVDAAGQVLLLRGCDPANPETLYWFTIGGGLDDGETFAEAAARELYEETGLTLVPSDLKGPVWTNVSEFPSTAPDTGSGRSSSWPGSSSGSRAGPGSTTTSSSSSTRLGGGRWLTYCRRTASSRSFRPSYPRSFSSWCDGDS
jgi:hypothetical protein